VRSVIACDYAGLTLANLLTGALIFFTRFNGNLVNTKQKQVCTVTHNSFNYVIMTTCFDPLLRSSSGCTPKIRNVFHCKTIDEFFFTIKVLIYVYYSFFVCIILENC
jgi:hypothetical protein